MVNKLKFYEIKVLNRVISNTTESSSFSIFEIVNDFNKGLSPGFDKNYIFNYDDMAKTLSNFLIDKGLAEKISSNNPQIQTRLHWLEKGRRLKKYGNYNFYKFMSDTLPELVKALGLIALIIGLVWTTIQIYNSCKKANDHVKTELK